MEIIACFLVLVYPTYLAGQAKTAFKYSEVFISVNDVLLMERDSTVHWMVNRQYEMTPSLVKRGFTCHT